MTDENELKYWREEKFKIQKTIELLKEIKRDMNIQDPKKVIERYIKKQEDELEEANECYEFYIVREIENESII